jgi:hypothetical protein
MITHDSARVWLAFYDNPVMSAGWSNSNLKVLANNFWFIPHTTLQYKTTTNPQISVALKVSKRV